MLLTPGPRFSLSQHKHKLTDIPDCLPNQFVTYLIIIHLKWTYFSANIINNNTNNNINYDNQSNSCSDNINNHEIPNSELLVQ